MNNLIQFNSISFCLLVCVFVLFVVIMVVEIIRNKKDLKEKKSQLSQMEDESLLIRRMLDQSIETLAFTIDARGRYTRGHSFRVAKYAKKIAKLDGKDETGCRMVYQAALLHDIGMIAIDDEIINKNGKLTDEEYEIIKTHPLVGARILEKMKDYTFLKDGAAYHHERYDGKGYPEGLAGTEIPEIARIIAVADAYDAMTSYRNYREMMDQADVKQEIWKCAGTQFDPHFAKLMVSLIDADIDYKMREIQGVEDYIFDDKQPEDAVWKTRLPHEIKQNDQVISETNIFLLGEFASVVNNWVTPSESVEITEQAAGFKLFSKTNDEANYLWYVPSVIVFSSEYGRLEDENYEELGVFVSTGYSWRAGSALTDFSEITKLHDFVSWDNWNEMNKQGMEYTFTAYLKEDVVYLTCENKLLKVESKLTLPEHFDKKIYLTATGEKCDFIELAKI